MVGEGRLPRTRDAEVFLLIRGSGWVRSAGAPVRGGVCGRGHAPPPFVGRTAHGPPVASCVCSDDTTVQLYCICICEHEARSMTIVAYLSAAGIKYRTAGHFTGQSYPYSCTAVRVRLYSSCRQQQVRARLLPPASSTVDCTMQVSYFHIF
jgi:hypothetical protein